MITILGATGNIGGRAAEVLLAKGEKVRVLARSQEKVAGLVAKGAEAKIGDANDVKYLTEAFKGSDAVFALIPPNFAVADFRKYQNEFGESVTKALEASGVKKIVFLSSIAAHLPAKTGPIIGVHDQEKRMKERLPSADILFLRPAYFMENLLANVGLIKAAGINGSVIKGDVSMHLVATKDIGDVAAAKLASRDFKGHSVLGISGPERLTMAQVTRAIGEAIGKNDLAYVAFSSKDAIEAMKQAGLTEDLASKYAEMSESLNDGTINEVDSPSVKGKVGIQEFVKSVFLPVFKA